MFPLSLLEAGPGPILLQEGVTDRRRVRAFYTRRGRSSEGEERDRVRGDLECAGYCMCVQAALQDGVQAVGQRLGLDRESIRLLHGTARRIWLATVLESRVLDLSELASMSEVASRPFKRRSRSRSQSHPPVQQPEHGAEENTGTGENAKDHPPQQDQQQVEEEGIAKSAAEHQRVQFLHARLPPAQMLTTLYLGEPRDPRPSPN